MNQTACTGEVTWRAEPLLSGFALMWQGHLFVCVPLFFIFIFCMEVSALTLLLRLSATYWLTFLLCGAHFVLLAKSRSLVRVLCGLGSLAVIVQLT